VPIVTIEMDHPSEDWKDENTYPVELKAGLRKEMQKHIHFKRLKDDYDHMACFFWEYHRTVAYLNIEYPAEYSGRENFFPFTENSFPDTPYLSHRLVQRRKWFSQLGGGGINYEEDLLTPFGESDHEIEVDGEKIVFPIFNVPLNLHVNPNWKLEKFLALVRVDRGSIPRGDARPGFCVINLFNGCELRQFFNALSHGGDPKYFMGCYATLHSYVCRSSG